MTYEEYSNLILNMLGSPIVEVEVKDKINSYIDVAFLEIKPSISTTKLLTIPYAKVVDLTDKGVYTIVSIFRGDIQDDYLNVSDESLMYGNSIVATEGFIDSHSLRMNLLLKQFANTITPTSDIDFVYKKPILYIDMSGNPSQTVTLEYIPDLKSVEEVDDPYWVNLIFRLSLAHTKIALGRVRSKIRVSSVPYELDGDTLLSEGNQELSEIRNKLEESIDLLYPLD